ncbi:hypothetical protein MMEU_1945 [Mycobacterium marinum str. Europe]|nr:hypothetical protein MMEU_1945 [Mycobacterium marinum str. Europe]
MPEPDGGQTGAGLVSIDHVVVSQPASGESSPRSRPPALP